MSRLSAIFLFVFLVACADRTFAPTLPSALAIGKIQQVYVATTRSRAETGAFGATRSADASYLNVGVSVPPAHRPGRVEYSQSRPDPNQHFVIASSEVFGSRAAFRSSLAATIAAKPTGEREVVIYVHGYNNSYADGLFRIAQLKNDLKLPGTAVHFSWPSAANPLGYTYDRDSMLFSRDGLEQVLRDVRAAGPRRIVLMGHSMGTMLVMETLRQIEIATPGWSDRSLNGVILISPDIDVDLFQAQALRIADLPQPFAIFTSNRDRVLQLSARLNGATNRLGTLDDPTQVAGLPVTLIDISEFASEGGGQHFTAGTSPVLISLLTQSAKLDTAFQRDKAGRAGLLPGTVITVQNATQLILSPQLVIQN